MGGMGQGSFTLTNPTVVAGNVTISQPTANQLLLQLLAWFVCLQSASHLIIVLHHHHDTGMATQGIYSLLFKHSRYFWER